MAIPCLSLEPCIGLHSADICQCMAFRLVVLFVPPACSSAFSSTIDSRAIPASTEHEQLQYAQADLAALSKAPSWFPMQDAAFDVPYTMPQMQLYMKYARGAQARAHAAGEPWVSQHSAHATLAHNAQAFCLRLHLLQWTVLGFCP